MSILNRAYNEHPVAALSIKGRRKSDFLAVEEDPLPTSQIIPATFFSWDELTRLLNALGYRAVKPGKTAGSRRKFLHPDRGWISSHQPHPGNVLKKYQITQIIDLFKREGIL